jgi:hypothetical protein
MKAASSRWTGSVPKLTQRHVLQTRVIHVDIMRMGFFFLTSDGQLIL